MAICFFRCLKKCYTLLRDPNKTVFTESLIAEIYGTGHPSINLACSP
jgi:hypothetical protein